MAVDSVNDSTFAFLNTSQSTETQNDGDLATEDFLALMTTQLQNQDPLEPMENGDFLGQIASFSTVSGIGDLNDSFASFAQTMQSGQALTASALVGHNVLVPSSLGNLTTESGMQAQIDVSTPVTDLKVQIYNEIGVPVRTLEFGTAAGATNFTWDGFNDAGEAMPVGVYQYRASGTINGENTAFETSTVARVDSVLVGSGNDGLTVNLAGLGSVSFNEVKEII